MTKRFILSLPTYVLICFMTVPVSAYATEIIGRDVLIDKLYPITGEPVKTVNFAIPFAFGSARLEAAANKQLDELGAALASERMEGLVVGVFGHTDASGPSAHNAKLSLARAKSVVRYMVRRFKLVENKITFAGYGESKPLYPADPYAAVNRRVEVTVRLPEAKPPMEHNVSEPRSEGTFIINK